MSRVAKLEDFMVNALTSSPLIPLGVNILRLADTLDNEGVVQTTSNIVVSYSGSSSNLKNRDPYVIEKSYSFKVTVTAQDYLSTSAHDFALTLKEGVLRTLINQVPFVDGVQVIEPFYSTDDTFEGVTKNSQYVYGITFRLTGEELYTAVSMDPCVRRGNCKAVWPPEGLVSKIPPGAVVTEDGRLWEVACQSEDGELVYGTYYNQEGDLLLKCDDSILVPKEELTKWYFQTTNFVTTEDNKLEVWLYDESGNQVERIFFSDTGKKVPRLLAQFYRSSVNGPAKFRSVLDSSIFKPTLETGSTYAVVDVIYAQVYENPLVYTDEYNEIPGGSIIMVNPDIRLKVNDITFIAVKKSDYGDGGWIDERAVVVENREEIYPAANNYLAERDGES
jgi:hypothetical protein